MTPCTESTLVALQNSHFLNVPTDPFSSLVTISRQTNIGYCATHCLSRKKKFSRRVEKTLYLQNLILVGGFTMCSLGSLQMWRSGTALAVVMVEFRVLREEYRAKQQAHLNLWRAVFCLCRDFFWKCPVGYVPGRRVQESCWFSRTSSSRLKIDP